MAGPCDTSLYSPPHADTKHNIAEPNSKKIPWGATHREALLITVPIFHMQVLYSTLLFSIIHKNKMIKKKEKKFNDKINTADAAHPSFCIIAIPFLVVCDATGGEFSGGSTSSRCCPIFSVSFHP